MASMSAKELSERRLVTVQTLLQRHGHLLEKTKLESFQQTWNAATEDVSFETLNPGSISRVNALFFDVSRSVTTARITLVQSKVATRVSSLKEQYGTVFEVTPANSQATEWLKGSASKDIHAVLDWIYKGNDLVKGKLYAPWGLCKCGRALRPARAGGAWKVFDQCGTCYHASKPAEAMVKDEVRAHKVSKPGSAARRGNGHAVNESVRPRDRKKGKAR